MRVGLDESPNEGVGRGGGLDKVTGKFFPSVTSVC